MSKIRTYSEMARFATFDERFDYLVLGGMVGEATFGFDRWINQRFYQSSAWKRARDIVILRDAGCDLGIPGREIHAELLVHHVNPIESGDILEDDNSILDPEFLITTTKDTHNAIHYGDRSRLRQPYVERTPGDTVPWR